MCGIVGIIGAQEEEWIERMSDAIRHRGPDDSGVLHDGNTTLAMRRLAIIDLTDGQQPMTTTDGRYSIVFNGEIFNASTLRFELEAAGVQFITDHSDTEVLLHMLVSQGRAALPRLNGMFAFAFWDHQKRTLLCARDRFGIKPFYFASKGRRFAFASELKCLLVLPWVDQDVDKRSLFHYMSLMYVPGRDTAVAGISRLQGGGWLNVTAINGVVDQGQWWVPQVGRSPPMPRAEALIQIRSALEDSIARWSTSDVPIACSLSGGLDSSAIVGLLASKGHHLRTYSVGFAGVGESAWNELPLARLVAKQWGTQHEEIVLNPESMLDDLLEMVWHLDEPYGGGLPSWSVFKEMASSAKVAMTGTGGDELFGNYGKWREIEGGCLRNLFGFKGSDFNQFQRHFFERYYYLSDKNKREFVFANSPKEFDTAEWLYQEFYSDHSPVTVRDKCAATDLATQLPEEFLMMTDRFSMAHSIEARTPFLDHSFAELVLSLPSDLRTKRGDLKGLLREAVADILPAQLLNAPKRGFVIPLTLWLRNKLRPMVELLLDPRRLAAQGLFRPEFNARYVQPHLAGTADNTNVVWAALMFQLWHIVFIEGKGVRPSFNLKDLSS